MVNPRHVCPECSRGFRFPESKAGLRVRCPACKQPLTLPCRVKNIEPNTAPENRSAPKPSPKLLTDINLFLISAACIICSLSVLYAIYKLKFLPTPYYRHELLIPLTILIVALPPALITFWPLYNHYLATIKLHEETAARERKALKKLLDDAIQKLAQEPHDAGAQGTLTKLAMDYPILRPRIYEAALAATESADGSSSSKQFALVIGRIHYGGSRADGLPTTYDEAAIRNDISARTNEM